MESPNTLAQWDGYSAFDYEHTRDRAQPRLREFIAQDWPQTRIVSKYLYEVFASQTIAPYDVSRNPRESCLHCENRGFLVATDLR